MELPSTIGNAVATRQGDGKMTLSDQLTAVFQFHCLQCHTLLSVPTRAIGSMVRCPGCSRTMTVPTSDAAFEESVSSWIAEDVAELWDEEDEVIDERLDAMLDNTPPAEEVVHTAPPPEARPAAEPEPMLCRPTIALRPHARMIRLFQ